MNKLTKGAIATAAGVILLMGGAGTLASWNSSAAAGASQSISAGQLALTSAGTGTWKNAQNATVTSSYKIVPGDVLTYSQTFNVAASGDNLYFTVATTPGAFGSPTGAANIALANQLSSTASFAVTGNTVVASGVTAGTYKVAAGSTASTITVSMTVTFPFTPATGPAVDNSAQNGTVTLGTGSVTLTQVASA